MMHRVTVVASGDFLHVDGLPVFPEFDFRPLLEHPRVAFAFLENTARIDSRQVADADILVLSGARITADSLHEAGRLALIAQFGAGFDHIDIAAATRNGVAVTNTPEGVRRPVALSILTLIFAVTGKLLIKTRLVGQGAAGWAAVPRHNGVGLTGKTLGSIGIGNIGAEMFRLAKPLDMRFLAHDPLAPAAAAELGVEMVDLDDLFRRSDVLCVNCPLTPATRHLVDARRIALMKPTAYLINTARGGVVDQRALTEALAAGRIAGAGLDVFEQEPLDPADPLLRLDNVVLTPHALCWSDELFAGCGGDAVKAALDVVAGRAPAYVINREILNMSAWRAKLDRLAQAGKTERDLTA